MIVPVVEIGNVAYTSGKGILPEGVSHIHQDGICQGIVRICCGSKIPANFCQITIIGQSIS